MIFKNGDLKETGAFFTSNPIKYATSQNNEILLKLKSCGEFSIGEVANILYPEIYDRGLAWRAQNGDWSETKFEGAKPYDFTKACAARIGQQIYQKFEEMGWVEKQESGKWKVTI